LKALRNNLRALKGLLGPKTVVLPVIKSDAYGHGLLPVARVLYEEGVYGFGISEITEALELRGAGFKGPLVLLSGFEKAWLPEIVRLRLTPVITDLWQLEILNDFLRLKDKSCPVHVKVNTGMNRFGLGEKDLQKALKILKDNRYLLLEGLMSHLSCSERPQDPLTRNQIECFLKMEKLVRGAGLRPRFRHLVNSGGIIFLPEAHFELVRPGLALYGAYPAQGAAHKLCLEPVMTFWARILSIRELPPGESLGYGPTYTALTRRRVALVPVGYEDGYLRSLSNRGFAFLAGKRIPVIGAISMKCLTLDVTEVPRVRPGDKVLLLGGRGRLVPAEELAFKAGTICYELFCALGSKAVKVYKE